MIEGLKADLTADELARLLDDRIEHHRAVAEDCEKRRLRLQAMTTPPDPEDPDDTDAQLAAVWPAYPENLERRAEKHRERAEAFRFLRDHLVGHEIYRLGAEDLEVLQLWPQGTAVGPKEEDE